MLQTTYYILDENYKEVGVIDDAISVVWSQRYSSKGDLVMELSASYFNYEAIKVGRTIHRLDEEGFMIIEDIRPYFTEEGEVVLEITGSSSEKILTKRVSKGEFTTSGWPVLPLAELVEKNFRKTDNERRMYPYFNQTLFDGVSQPEFEETYRPNYIYELVKMVCERCGYGFKVYFDREAGDINLLIYEGVDRTLWQTDREPVIFSEEFDNLRKGEYLVKTSHEKTLVYVLTSEEGPLSTIEVYSGEEPYGTHRKETLHDAYDLSTENMTPEEIEQVASSRGMDVLRGLKVVGVLDGASNLVGPYKYGRDFKLGDLVQCDIFGQSVRARVVEVIRTENSQGLTDYVSFDFSIEESDILWRDPMPPYD